MNKKLVLIISSLFLVQIVVYLYTHYNSDKINAEVKVLNINYEPTQNGVLRLEHKNLPTIPTGILKYKKELWRIYLGDNDFTEFPYELLSMPNLHTIHIESNKITSLDFSNLDLKYCALTELVIYNNKITEIKGLERFPSLKKIEIQRNNLSKIPLLPKSINEADFSRNKITTLNMSTIPPKLKRLMVNDNLLNSIIPSPESADYELITLGIQRNPIDTLVIDSQTIAPVLRELYLEGLVSQQIAITHPNLERLVMNYKETRMVNLDLPKLKVLSIPIKSLVHEINQFNAPKVEDLYIYKSKSYNFQEIREATTAKFPLAKVTLMDAND
ncbi:MAG: leucine-rich repeat domain-containing protein [Saprospiraceae bacterium]